MNREDASLSGWWSSGSDPVMTTRENADPDWKLVFERSPS